MTEQELLPVLKRTSDGRIMLPLHVQPGAKRDAIAGMYGEQALKLATSAPPVDGKANAALFKILAKMLKCSKSSITLLSGETSRDKTLEIHGINKDALINILNQHIL